MIDKQRLNGAFATDRLPADTDDDLADTHSQARLGEGRIGIAVPRIATQDSHDAIAAAALVEREVRAEQTDFVERRPAVISEILVRVRCAQFALHLPEQVRQVAARADA